MANNCAVCGANLNMVGRSHRCIPKIVRRVEQSNQLTSPGGSAKEPSPVVGDNPVQARTITYKYRDPEKRRAYQRELMRKKRENHFGADVPGKSGTATAGTKPTG